MRFLLFSALSASQRLETPSVSGSLWLAGNQDRPLALLGDNVIWLTIHVEGHEAAAGLPHLAQLGHLT